MKSNTKTIRNRATPLASKGSAPNPPYFPPARNHAEEMAAMRQYADQIIKAGPVSVKDFLHRAGLVDSLGRQRRLVRG